RVHVHVAEADVLGARVDLQRRCLLLLRADDSAVAHREDRLLAWIAPAFDANGAGAGTDVLALMAVAVAALPDAEAARFAEIVTPRVAAPRRIGFVTGTAPLRVDVGRRLQREADLRIGIEVGAAALAVRTGASDDLAGRAIGELGRAREWPL